MAYDRDEPHSWEGAQVKIVDAKGALIEVHNLGDVIFKKLDAHHTRELEVMREITAMLEHIGPDERTRILSWAMDKFVPKPPMFHFSEGRIVRPEDYKPD